jgi:GT2 family glycosyltransferase
VSEPPLIVVVAYRSDPGLGRCLRTLDAEFPTVVVDNDNSAPTAAVAHQAEADYLPSDRNVGFAAAVNLALAAHWDGRRDVLLLNPDARISGADVERLQLHLHTQPRLAAVGPRLVDDAGHPQRADWPIPSPAQVWTDGLGMGGWWRGRRFVTGAVLLLRGEALSAVGRLDERYFLYYEESDWQLRAQRAGWSVGVDDAVLATHSGAASSSDQELRERLFHASAEVFARRWYGRPGWWLLRAGALVAAARRAALGSPEARRQARRTVRLYLRGPAACAPPWARRAPQ